MTNSQWWLQAVAENLPNCFFMTAVGLAEPLGSVILGMGWSMDTPTARCSPTCPKSSTFLLGRTKTLYHYPKRSKYFWKKSSIHAYNTDTVKCRDFIAWSGFLLSEEELTVLNLKHNKDSKSHSAGWRDPSLVHTSPESSYTKPLVNINKTWQNITKDEIFQRQCYQNPSNDKIMWPVKGCVDQTLREVNSWI